MGIMSEAAWLTCGSRGQMRSFLSGRAFSRVRCRWLRFNLACLERIPELLDDPASHHFLRVITGYASDPNRDTSRQFISEQAVVREVRRGFYSRRNQPLMDARCSASLALEAVVEYTLKTSEMVATAIGRRAGRNWPVRNAELRAHCDLLRDIFGNPFRPVVFDPRWLSASAVALARTAYETRNFSLLPILADALEDARCDSAEVLNHCRGLGLHVCGCWVVDGVLGRA